MEGLRLTDFIQEHPLQIFSSRQSRVDLPTYHGIFSSLGVRLGRLVTGAWGEWLESAWLQLASSGCFDSSSLVPRSDSLNMIEGRSNGGSCKGPAGGFCEQMNQAAQIR